MPKGITKKNFRANLLDSVLPRRLLYLEQLMIEECLILDPSRFVRRWMNLLEKQWPSKPLRTMKSFFRNYQQRNLRNLTNLLVFPMYECVFFARTTVGNCV